MINIKDLEEVPSVYHFPESGLNTLYSSEFVEGISRLGTSLKQTLSHISTITKQPRSQQNFQHRIQEHEASIIELKKKINDCKPSIDQQDEKMQQSISLLESKKLAAVSFENKDVKTLFQVLFEIVYNKKPTAEELEERVKKNGGVSFRDSLHQFNCSKLIDDNQERFSQLMEVISEEKLKEMLGSFTNSAIFPLLSWLKYLMKNYECRMKQKHIEKEITLHLIDIEKLGVDEEENQIRKMIRNMHSVNESKSKILRITEKIENISQRIRSRSRFQFESDM